MQTLRTYKISSFFFKLILNSKSKIVLIFLFTGGEIDDDVSSVHSVLTEEERFRLREVIMTDERIQTILKETHTTERMMMLKDYR